MTPPVDGRPPLTPAILPRALRLSPAAVGTLLTLLLAGPGSPGRAQEAGLAPAGEIPTLQGTR